MYDYDNGMYTWEKWLLGILIILVLTIVICAITQNLPEDYRGPTATEKVHIYCQKRGGVRYDNMGTFVCNDGSNGAYVSKDDNSSDFEFYPVGEQFKFKGK